MRQSILRVSLLLAALAAAFAFAQSRSYGDTSTTEGCLNQNVFNGVWRLEVTGVEPYMNGGKQAGWQVTEVWRNGTSQQLHPADSFLQDQRLVLDNGTILASASTTGTLSLQSVANNGFPPAGQFTYKQIFYDDNASPSNKPKAVDVMFDAAKLAAMKDRPHFTTSQYNFHVKLDCTASAAASGAQGGSTQISAREGCMNEWMSNGVWKMRVTTIAPKEQYGWTVSQEWVNATGRPLYPGVLPSGPALETNVTDEYLVTQGGISAASGNTAGDLGTLWNHRFAPGGTFAFDQLFGWSPFDPNDKPIRLLVTFDAAKQNKLAGHPHYLKPANFRISLDCTK